MLIIDVEQNSPEWFEKKLGKISGSRVAKVRTTKLANKTDILDAVITAQRFEDKEKLDEFKKATKKMSEQTLEALIPKDTYKKFWYRGQKKEYWKLLAEKLGYVDDVDEYGKVEDPRSRGHRLEDSVAEKFESISGLKTVKVGICIREDHEDISVSPDRLIATVISTDEGDITVYQGAVEIKNPGVQNHLEIYFTQRVPDEYWEQVLQYFVVNDDLEKLYFISNNENVRDRPTVILEIERKDIEKEIAQSLADQIKIVEHLKEDMLALSF